MEEHEILGVLSQDEVIPAAYDSNFGRLLTATAERLFTTRMLRRVYIAYQPLGTGVDYPNGAVFPGEPPETEFSNFTNQITYTVQVALSTIGTLDPWKALFQLLNIREEALEVCRTKDKVEMMAGDLHENTLINSPAFVIPVVEDGVMMFSTGFYVNYLVTEPRKAE